jgi:hypothetical protein
MASTTIFDASMSSSRPKLGVGHSIPVSLSAQRLPATLTPTPMPNPVKQSNSPNPNLPQDHNDYEHYRLLNKGEWLQFCRGIGILKDEESEEVIRATSWLWPPSSFKDGLYSDGELRLNYSLACHSVRQESSRELSYKRKFANGKYLREVLYEKTKFAYYYHSLSIIAWAFMLLQLVLSAILTGLGATHSDNGTPIVSQPTYFTSIFSYPIPI